MTVTPNIAGFIAAQDDLRRQFGTDATFRQPVDAEWPDGTRINSDTGRPYDATAVRTNDEFTETTITVLIILKQGSPLRPQADTHWDQVGLMSGMDIILDVANEDWDSVSEASEFVCQGITYELEERKPFSIANTPYRRLVYGMQK